MKRRLRVFIMVAAIGSCWLSTVSASATCEASASSDGVTAQALAACSSVPDEVILEPLSPACDALSYDLIVRDDAETAVFPTYITDQVLVESATAGVESEGIDNHFGSVLDVAGIGGESQYTGVASQSDPGLRRFSASGRWWSRTCWESDPHSGRLRRGSVDGPFPEGPEVPLSQLISVARAQVNPPPLPPVAHAGPASLLQLPTWFWIDSEWWTGSYRGHAEHGRASVTVEAMPISWQLAGDGNSLMGCDGRGIEWVVDADDRDACTHTFRDAVGESEVMLAATAEMAVVWTSSIAEYGVQPLDPLFRSSTVAHQIVEVVGLRGPAATG